MRWPCELLIDINGALFVTECEVGGWGRARYARRISGLPRGFVAALARAVGAGVAQAFLAPAPVVKGANGQRFDWRRVIAAGGRLYCRLPLEGQAKPDFERALVLFGCSLSALKGLLSRKAAEGVRNEAS